MGKCAFMDQNDNQPIHCLDVNSDSQEVSISLVYSLNSASKSYFLKCIKSHRKAVSISKINPRVSYNCKYESMGPMRCSVYLVTTDFPHIMTGDLCCHSTGVCVTPETLSARWCQDKSWDKNIPQNSWGLWSTHTPCTSEAHPTAPGPESLSWVERWEAFAFLQSSWLCQHADPETRQQEHLVSRTGINLSPVKSVLTSKHYDSGRLKMGTKFLFQKRKEKTES